MAIPTTRTGESIEIPLMRHSLVNSSILQTPGTTYGSSVNVGSLSPSHPQSQHLQSYYVAHHGHRHHNHNHHHHHHHHHNHNHHHHHTHNNTQKHLNISVAAAGGVLVLVQEMLLPVVAQEQIHKVPVKRGLRITYHRV